MGALYLKTCFDPIITTIISILAFEMEMRCLLFAIPDVPIGKLQRLQNSAARLICGIPRYSHTTTILHTLHWLPVSFGIILKDRSHHFQGNSWNGARICL